MKTYLRYGVSGVALLAAVAVADAQNNDRQGAGPQGGASMSDSRSGQESGGKMESPRSERGAQNEQGSRPQNGNAKSAQEHGQTGEYKGKSAQGSEDQGKSAQGAHEQKGKTAQEQRNERNEKGAQNRNENENKQVQGENRTDRNAQNNRTESRGNATAEKREGREHAHVRVTDEQKTRIHDVVVHDSGIRKVSRSNIHFSLNVGTRIPDSVVFYDAPLELISIDAELQDFKVIVLDDGVVLIVDPATREIVDVIEV